MRYIVVDLGSTFVKSAVFDIHTDELLFEEKYESPKNQSTVDGCFENNAYLFVEIVKKIIENVYKKIGVCDGILFSTQQHGCVLTHPMLKEDLFISWQDTRSMKINPKTQNTYLDDLMQLLPREAMQSTGVYIKPALALCNVYTLFEERNLPKIAGTKMYTLGSYVINALTGKNICHITNAAPLGFANILTGSWETSILEKTGLDFIELPEISMEMNIAGNYVLDGFDLPVYLDAGDVQTCTYGAGADVDDLLIHIGTSGQLIYVCDNFEIGDFELRPYFEGKFCKVVSRMPGGRNFDVQIEYIKDIAEKLFGLKLTIAEICKKIDAISLSNPNVNTDLVVDCNFYDMPDGRVGGSISNILNNNLNVLEVFQATVNDFGNKYKKYSDMLLNNSALKGSLYFVGGALIKNMPLQNAILNALGIASAKISNKEEVYQGMLRLVKSSVKIGEIAV